MFPDLDYTIQFIILILLITMTLYKMYKMVEKTSTHNNNRLNLLQLASIVDLKSVCSLSRNMFEQSMYLLRFREAGAEVIEVLSRFSKCIERASVDEAYIDLTSEVDRRMADMDPHSITTKHLQNTFVVADEFNRDSTDNGLVFLILYIALDIFTKFFVTFS